VRTGETGRTSGASAGSGGAGQKKQAPSPLGQGFLRRAPSGGGGACLVGLSVPHL